MTFLTLGTALCFILTSSCGNSLSSSILKNLQGAFVPPSEPKWKQVTSKYSPVDAPDKISTKSLRSGADLGMGGQEGPESGAMTSPLSHNKGRKPEKHLSQELCNQNFKECHFLKKKTNSRQVTMHCWWIQRGGGMGT